MSVMRLLAVLWALLSACSTTKPVDVAPKLGERDVAPAGVAASVRVALLPPRLPPPPPGQPSRDTAPLPRTHASFTVSYGEIYPSLKHLTSTLPVALKEVGFDVVHAKTREEAVRTGVSLILEPVLPELEGFRRAVGGGLLLEGTIYDVHVHYGVDASTGAGRPLGLIRGHGEGTGNFFFEDPYLQTAIVGGASLAVMFASAAVVGLPLMAGLGAFTQLNYDARNPLQSGPVVNRLDVSACVVSMQSANARTGVQREHSEYQNLCGRLYWVVAALGVATMVGAVSSVALGTTRFVASRIFNVVTGFFKNYLSEPVWEGLLQDAHDRAARSLADAVFLAAARAERTAPAPGARP
jgi:hypothetical protein